MKQAPPSRQLLDEDPVTRFPRGCSFLSLRPIFDRARPSSLSRRDVYKIYIYICEYVCACISDIGVRACMRVCMYGAKQLTNLCGYTISNFP